MCGCSECVAINAYFAGLLDGEGYVGIRTVQRKNPSWNYSTYALQVTISNTVREPLDEAKRIWGGSINSHQAEKRIVPCFVWAVTSKQASRFLEDVVGYSKIKRPQIMLALELQDFVDKNGCKGKTKTPEQLDYMKSLQDEIRKYNSKKYNGEYTIRIPLSIGGGCLDCGCMLPANEHNDKRHITYQDYQKGDRADQSTVEVNKTTMSKVRQNIRTTLAAINNGKLSPSKKK